MPVSSSGHLLFFENIFKVENNLILLNLFLHLATLFAVIIFYRDIIIKLIKKPFQPLTYKLIISTIITVIIALLYEIFNLDNYLSNYYGYFFLITATILLITHLFQKKAVRIKVGEVSYKNSLLAGFVQGIAVLPGISRSGSTISALVLTGNDEKKSAEYSFLLSIPIIIGGFIFEAMKVENWSQIFFEIKPILFFVGFAVTFLVSLLSLKLTVKFLKQNKFIYFSIYLFLLGLFIIIVL